MKPFPVYFPPEENMIADLNELDLSIGDKQLELLGEFAGILIERSALTNLVGPREKQRLWKRHILESLCYSSLLDIEQSVVDIGSGNGFPGIILAILGYRITLLEPRRTRYLFLDWAARKLKLADCSAVRSRLEDFLPENQSRQFTGRAVAPPSSLLSTIGTISGTGSVLVYRQPELVDDHTCERYTELKSPPLDRSGFLVQYRV